MHAIMAGEEEIVKVSLLRRIFALLKLLGIFHPIYGVLNMAGEHIDLLRHFCVLVEGYATTRYDRRRKGLSNGLTGIMQQASDPLLAIIAIKVSCNS